MFGRIVTVVALVAVMLYARSYAARRVVRDARRLGGYLTRRVHRGRHRWTRATDTRYAVDVIRWRVAFEQMRHHPTYV